VKNLNSSDVKRQVDEAIGVLEARAEYFLKGEITEGEHSLLCRVIDHLEKWRGGDEIHYLPELTAQCIWFKQYARCQV